MIITLSLLSFDLVEEDLSPTKLDGHRLIHVLLKTDRFTE